MDPVLLASVCVVTLLLIVCIVAIAKLRSTSARLASANKQLEKYAPVIDIDGQVEKTRAELTTLTTERDEFAAADQARRTELNATYQQALATFNRLRSEVALLEENLEDISFGLYKPHYTFETSQEFKSELERVYERKKEMIRNGEAAFCAVPWQVNNSKAEGERMMKQAIKVMLRAFNGEVDAAVAKVTWNNVTRMEERIRKAYEAINKSATVNQITITGAYLDVALAELRIGYEYENKKHEEQEEQRRIREQMREEEKAQREAERAKQEAATEEARYEKALAKARLEVEKAQGEELGKVNEKVAELEKKLAEAHEKMQRAMSLAQFTKIGHVYVISNVGSFGETTFKIGMTRRLDPMDRVHELGDASVPFAFDVHAMIYSEDAPALENSFHRKFADRRMNLVNMRKEYFNVTLDEIEAFAREQNVSIEFTKVAEAREYRETLAMKEQAARNAEAAQEGAAPAVQALAPAVEVELFPTQLLAG